MAREIVTHETQDDYNAKKMGEKPDAKPYTINANHDIPYGGGTSKDGAIVYIDKRLPQELSVDGKTINIHKSIAVHEHEEWKKMHHMGYATAHSKYANPAEKEYVERHGIDWKKYDEKVEGLVRKIEHSPNPDIPKDLNLKPYGKGCRGNKDDPQLGELHKKAMNDA